jgi:hypothetical protein
MLAMAMQDCTIMWQTGERRSLSAAPFVIRQQNDTTLKGRPNEP